MIDQLVLFVMALNKNLEAGELFRRELDLGLREKSSGSSAAVPGLSVRVASAVHGILVLALIAARILIVKTIRKKYSNLQCMRRAWVKKGTNGENGPLRQSRQHLSLRQLSNTQ